MVPANLKRRVIVVALGTAAVSLAITPRSFAQVRFEFTPFVGLYLPTSNVIDQFSTACSCQLSVKQKTNFAVGGRVAAWVSDRLAVEGSFGYSGSGVTAKAAGFGSADTSANIVTGSARLLVGLGPPALNTSFYLSGGLGLVAHGGDAYTGTSGTTRVGAVAGVGARFKVAPSLAVRAELEDYLFSAQFSATSGGGQTNSKFQNDLVLSLGLAIPLGGQ
jgi:hypothetical protein